MIRNIFKAGMFITAAALLTPSSVFADTIDPASYSASLGVGESVTIRKTVTIEESVTTGVLDVMFLIDTSGSMGTEIANAKAAAADILTGLSAFGDLATGTGYYSEPGSKGVYSDLTTTDADTIAVINSWTTGFDGGGFGGDFPEEGIKATYEAAKDASWRPGSTRFIIALGDATFKESDGVTKAMALSALDSSGATFIGIDFRNMTRDDFGGIDPTELADATGGSIVPTAAGTDALIASISSAVTDSFASYSDVTVSDLGAGMPGVGVSVECVSADGAACAGDTASGSYDRSTSRVFEYDVTFTGMEDGAHAFDTHALVDGGIVASEADRITVSSVPEPGVLALMAVGLLGMGSIRRRK